MNVANELSTLEDSLEEMNNKIRVVNGTMQMLTMSLDAGINTAQASWVATGLFYNTNHMISEIEKIINETIEIRKNIEKITT